MKSFIFGCTAICLLALVSGLIISIAANWTNKVAGTPDIILMFGFLLLFFQRLYEKTPD